MLLAYQTLKKIVSPTYNHLRKLFPRETLNVEFVVISNNVSQFKSMNYVNAISQC